MYGTYHEIIPLGKEDLPKDYMYDITGSLCENNDKFAIDRMLPKIEVGDIWVICDAGAHGSARGYNYNGKLHCAEYLILYSSVLGSKAVVIVFCLCQRLSKKKKLWKRNSAVFVEFLSAFL